MAGFKRLLSITLVFHIMPNVDSIVGTSVKLRPEMGLASLAFLSTSDFVADEVSRAQTMGRSLFELRS